MPAGLQVVGDHGVLQIDELYRNLSKRASGAAGASVNWASGVTPILAVRTTHTGGVFPAFLTISGSSFTWTFRETPTSCTYWVFDVPVSSGNVGIQVFDASGNMVFDSSLEYLKVVGVHELNFPSGGAYGGITQPGGKTYAWVQIDSGLWTENKGGGITEQGGYKVYINGSGQFVTVDSLFLTSSSGPSTASPRQHIRKPVIMVIDVTDM